MCSSAGTSPCSPHPRVLPGSLRRPATGQPSAGKTLPPPGCSMLPTAPALERRLRTRSKTHAVLSALQRPGGQARPALPCQRIQCAFSGPVLPCFQNLPPARRLSCLEPLWRWPWKPGEARHGEGLQLWAFQTNTGSTLGGRLAFPASGGLAEYEEGGVGAQITTLSCDKEERGVYQRPHNSYVFEHLIPKPVKQAVVAQP